MKWFKHLTNAHDNNKLTKVRMKYGAEGYAIYWYCLELIAHDLGTDNNINFELKHDAEVIGHNLRIDSKKVEEIMRYMVELKLFEVSDNVITCLKLAKYLDKKITRNPLIHKVINSYETVRDNSRQSRNCPGLSPPDLDLDLDLDLKTKNICVVTDTPKPKKFIKPTLQEIQDYCRSRHNDIDPVKFFNFYEAKNWMIGKNPMKNWKAAVITWERSTPSTQSETVNAI